MGLGAVNLLIVVTMIAALFESQLPIFYLLGVQEGVVKPRNGKFAAAVIGIGVVYPSALIVYLVHALIDPVAPTLVLPFIILAASMIVLALSSLIIIAGFVSRKTLTLLTLTIALVVAAEGYLTAEVIMTLPPPYVYCNYCM